LTAQADKWYTMAGLMISPKKLLTYLSFILIALAGFAVGRFVVAPQQRIVETSRMEKCLQIYREYRKNENQKQLAEDLALISLTPKDFQEIIDRFIYYRSRKSGMNQAMELLKAFRAGYDIKTAEVVSISGLGSEPFRLDAEILAVFENQPDLIKQAFEG